MKHRLIEGRLLYTSRKPGMEGHVRGFESFMFTRHSDGKVTLRAHCEIEEPEPTVMRDIIYSLDEHGQPMDLHVRLTVGDAFMDRAGSGSMAPRSSAKAGARRSGGSASGWRRNCRSMALARTRLSPTVICWRT